MHEAAWQVVGLCFPSWNRSPVAAQWPQHSCPCAWDLLAEPPHTHYTRAAGVGHSACWTWGMRLFPTFKNCFERDEGRNPSLLTFFSPTFHLTSLAAGAVCKSHSSYFIWENMCSAAQLEKLLRSSKSWSFMARMYLHCFIQPCAFLNTKLNCRLEVTGKFQILWFVLLSPTSPLGCWVYCTFL